MQEDNKATMINYKEMQHKEKEMQFPTNQLERDTRLNTTRGDKKTEECVVFCCVTHSVYCGSAVFSISRCDALCR